MIKIEIIFHSSASSKIIFAPEEKNLQRILIGEGISVDAICGGHGVCGKCKVKLVKGFMKIAPADKSHFSEEELEKGWRLACAAFPSQDIALEVPSSESKDGFAAITESRGEFKEESGESGEFQKETGLQTDEILLAKDRQSITSRVRAGYPDDPLTIETLRSCSDLVESGSGSAYVTRAGGKILRVSPSRQNLFAVAVDIGTTTLGFALVNMENGAVTGRLSMVNAQRQHGADVISRIRFASEEEKGLSLLSGLIQRQIAEGIKKLCQAHGLEETSIVKVAVVGNTGMLHLLLGLSCKTLGAYPFTPVTLERLQLRLKDVIETGPSCELDVLPGLSAYVGADVVAGVFFAGLHRKNRPTLFLDLGTNGEIVVCRGKKIFCTSTAAGPAFEGGNILWGTGSVPGAISSVRFEEKAVRISVIGGSEPPCGICGSGVIDAAAQCLLHGRMGKNGRFAAEYKQGIVLGLTGKGEEIRFTQKDVREVQLAKSAIRSGIDRALALAELSCDDVGEFFLAGGFGYGTNFESGAHIGLFPKELAGKMTHIGNSALGGAVKYLLSPAALREIDFIQQNSTEFNLAEDKAFNKMFIDNTYF